MIYYEPIIYGCIYSNLRYKRGDGFYQVYIRVVHRSKMGYIKTEMFITEKQLTKAGEIKDAVVNEFCSREILWRFLIL